MLGATVPTIGGIKNAFYWGDRWDCQAVQFYLTLSRTWKVNQLSEKEILEFKTAWKNSNVKEVVAHIPYLVNLISFNTETREKSIERLTAEIERAKLLDVKYLVLHPGTFKDISKEEAINLFVSNLEKVLKKIDLENVKILIETMAGQKNSLGSSFSEIKEILSKITGNSFGVCVDSAHLFEAGYDVSADGYDDLFKLFEKEIDLKKIMAFHLNDSKTKFNSKVDRHQHIGQGEIELGFFEKLLNDKRFKNIPKIIETPLMGEKSEQNLEVLRDLVKS